MTRTLQDSPATAEWVLCPGCTTPLYGKRWLANLSVCPECGRHDAVSAPHRLAQLLDPGYELLVQPAQEADPLRFVDSRPYPQRLAEARARTDLDEAVLCAVGQVAGEPAVVAVMDFGFLGGSLGVVAGDRIVLAAETALARRVPLVLVTASGGARMQEGALSLMQMARTSAALARLDAAGVLTISVVTDPTYGGVAASFATLADVIVTEPGARLGFAGRRVIEQTIRRQLPAEFQTAEFLAERGFVDKIVQRPQLRQELARLLRLGAGRAGPEGAPLADGIVRDPDRLPPADAWAQTRAARDLARPTALEYATLVFDDFQELRGDRATGDCRAVIGGPAWLAGRPVMLIGHQKGHTPAELLDRNFGMPTPAGNRKAARLMRLAEKLGIPIVTLIDTPGADPGPAAEEQGQAYTIAENLRLMAALRVPSVAVVIGEGGSGGALALGVANRVLVLERAIYSVISPEGCAAILWKDAAAAPLAAAALRLTARDLLALGVVDGVIPEPEGGCGADHLAAVRRLRAALCGCLAELSPLRGDELVADRRARLERFTAARFGSPPAEADAPVGGAG
ncbi:acetyl-CoA carboxylase carboxyltransferase subunit alpha/beta [Micromonospora sp. KC721]|uniref:acetyl-CoA carboxylase carboxyltransferase subunit alpha/beta n=1 Tax=Micromonospora sp. KC721 TaxID=2530380 RepID=UPI00104AB893|nr:acetyl-CoA carboxylase carboxyltransferase subunit alpha/beta [Micromonospora sp. KC721]TDB80621.1 acetyl-CoA carboxylase carboxyl transferase subunit beta [Micromonospora sp. KC721]